ncbi:MAG: NAD(P)/FAD-dependent oxidoreductase [Candidatus Omnitrophica bacterium]|nr:NAD(P)/FAD-dependent oxidoreductase [Candidatus Omnitrophota bacterium]
MFDVAIIGGGAVGTSIARELSRYKLLVVVLEKEEEPAFGVSKSNSGIIHPGTQNPPGLLKSRLCVEGNRLTRVIAQELGVDFKEVGELIVAFTEEEIFRLHRLLEDARALRVPGVRMVDQVWLRGHEPHLSPRVKAALFAPTAGIISPYRLVYDLAENALRNGVQIHTDSRVTAIENTRPHFIVHTSKGPFKAKYVVNAAGLYADGICRMLGITDVAIKPVKGEEFILDKKRAYLTNHLIFPLPSQSTKGILVIKTADGNPMVGPTATEAESKEDLSTSQEGLEKVFSAVKRMVPEINEKDIIAYFAGLRPKAGEDFIIRSEQAAHGCITVAGIQSPGLTAAPAIARMVTRLLRQQGLGLRRKILFHGHRKRSVHLFAVKPAETQKLIEQDPGYGDIVCRCEMVSAKEIRDAILRGATTLDGIKFRTRCQAGRCHGSFCTTRVMKMLAGERGIPVTAVTKRGKGSEVVKHDRADD